MRRKAKNAGRSKKAATPASWKPGQSGNPSGGAKLTEDQREARIEAQTIIDAASPAAARRLIEWMESDDAKASVAASATLLDRAGLKGVTRLELGGPNGQPLSPETKVTHVLDPSRLIRLIHILSAAGALPSGVGGSPDALDASAHEIHGAGADGSTDGVPPR